MIRPLSVNKRELIKPEFGEKRCHQPIIDSSLACDVLMARSADGVQNQNGGLSDRSPPEL